MDLMKILLDASFLHNKEEKYYYKYRLHRVTSLKQLILAELSGEY